MTQDNDELIALVREAGDFCDTLTSPEENPGTSSVHLYARARAIAAKARRLLADRQREWA